MADVNAKVVSMVERALKRDPDIKSATLKVRAAKIDKSVAGLSGRQFHARYVIQVRKRLFGGAKRRRVGPASKTASTGSGSPSTGSFLLGTFKERRAELEAAIDAAFGRALATDSAKQVDKLLASLERHREELEKA